MTSSGAGPAGDNPATILAIETSQRDASVAVQTPEGVLWGEPLSPADRHSDDLMPAIDRLTRRHEIAPSDLDMIAVSIGPGGFSGLRIAITTAKMIAEVTGARVIGVPSALVAAYGIDAWRTETQVQRVAIALACKRDSCWLTHCVRVDRPDGGAGTWPCWQIEGTPGIVAADELSLDPRSTSALLCDEHLPQSMRNRCSVLNLPMRPFAMSAVACLQAGCDLAEQGQCDDPLTLGPIYAREPEAVRMWRQRG